MTDPREAAIVVIRTLRDAGHTAWLAGGCVRDELLGRRPKDYDVATDATPDRVRTLFRRTNEVGVSFGVMLVRDRGQTIEVTTFRREGAYSDSRRPDEVEYADAESDARRRDFTINALYLDPLEPPGDIERTRGVSGRVIDYVGGLADLDRRIIRAVGDPDRRLAEDHLRALRGVRFAASLGFGLDPRTADAMANHARELVGVSRERIGDEVRRMLASPTRSAATHLLESLGLDAPILSENPIGPRRPHDPTILASLTADATTPTALAAWSIEREARRRGMDTGGFDLRALVEPPAEPPRPWRAALCLSNDERDALVGVLRLLSDFAHQWPSLNIPNRKRRVASEHYHAAHSILNAADPDLARRIADDADALANDGVGLAPPAWLTGDDLIAMGFQPGPALGRALHILYDEQLQGAFRDRPEAEQRALRMLHTLDHPPKTDSDRG